MRVFAMRARTDLGCGGGTGPDVVDLQRCVVDMVVVGQHAGQVDACGVAVACRLDQYAC